jgi:hypothetical protein
MKGTKTAGRSSDLVTATNSLENKVHDVRVRYMSGDLYPRRCVFVEGQTKWLDCSKSHLRESCKPWDESRPTVIFPATAMKSMNNDVLEAPDEDHGGKTSSGDVELPDQVEETQAMDV